MRSCKEIDWSLKQVGANSNGQRRVASRARPETGQKPKNEEFGENPCLPQTGPAA